MSLIPGALYDPGVHWNYQAGRTLAAMLVWHYTVGSNSIALIRDRGLAPVLIRDDVIWQFAPLDARCFTQCEWNSRSIGYEVESLDGSISDAELANLGYATVWALTQHGIPAIFYDGPRMDVGTPYVGVTNHRNLRHNACDMHSDGFDRWVWDAIMGATPPPEEESDVIYLWCETDPANPGMAVGLVIDGGFIVWESVAPPGYAGNPQDPWLVAFLDGDNAFGSGKINTRRKVTGAKITEARRIHANLLAGSSGGGGGTGGASPAEVSQIVAASEQRVRSDVNRARTVQ